MVTLNQDASSPPESGGAKRLRVPRQRNLRRTAGRAGEWSAGRTASRGAGRVTERGGDRRAEREDDRGTGRGADRRAERGAGRGADQVSGRGTGPGADRMADRMAGRGDDRVAGRGDARAVQGGQDGMPRPGTHGRVFGDAGPRTSPIDREFVLRAIRRPLRAGHRWMDQGTRPGPVRDWVNAVSAVAVAGVARWAPGFLTIGCVVLFVVLGSSVIRPRHLFLDAGVVGASVLAVLVLTGQQFWSFLPVSLVLLGSMLLGWLQRRQRAVVEAGLRDAGAADAVLVDLRNEMLIRSAVPLLPAGWCFDADLRPAHGDCFSGDFVITRQPTPGRLEVALVDVSGNGYRAGARALLLAGALRALLEAVPAREFLAAANHHVVHLATDEAFATAVHVSIDLEAGGFAIVGAGHPPVAHYHAGSGRWQLLDAEQGPALGLIPGATYPVITGRLERDDALLLYTDGLVESRRLDVGRGIDRLIGRADPVIACGIDGAAARISGAIRSEEGDDRALVIIRRG